MSQRINKIEQELVRLEAAIALMGQQLLTNYAPYLKLLGKTVQRQLVMAVYQVCTDVYADTFLRLSLNQRINLQTKVRQIAQGIMAQLLTPLADLEKIISPPQLPDLAPQIATPIVTPITPLITNVGTSMGTNIDPMIDTQTINQGNHQVTNQSINQAINQIDTQTINQGNHQVTNQSINQIDNQVTNQASNAKEINKLAKVRELVNWQQQTEVEIGQILQQGSKEVNNLLYQAGLLAQKLPIALLETAAKVESLNTASVVSRPNTINLLMETENATPEAEYDPPQEPLHLTAIYLRLGDLEFNDPELGKTSNSMRAMVGKLHGLDREYHKQLKAYQVAQAQAAWRSTWVED